MAEFTQDGRSLRVETELGPDVLLLESFEGRESIGGLFQFHLELVAERSDIDPAEVLRKPMWVELELPDGSKRFFSGICNGFAQGATDAMLTSYSATIVPWTWFLTLRRDCRIFQEMTPQDILAQVFVDAGYSGRFEDRTASRPQREFCVQYRESDYNFVHRLMEHEGIFYYFKHEAGEHTLVLIDSNASLPAVPGAVRIRMTDDPGRDEDVVERFGLRHSARIGKVTYRDYDHLQPSFTLESSLSGEDGEEAYDYSPGRYVTREGGEALAQYELEAEEALREEGNGASDCRQMVAGHTFTLFEHPNERANQEYLLLEVHHRGNNGDYRSSGANASLEYANSFQCIPTALPYRPRRSTPKPVVRGSQTAVVVGPAGEEIYTDNHGRVKLQFHWDRVGKKDENSSCWIRVSHPWAGKGWGAVSIPRIGQEVIVDFLEGDPDQPIIVGRVYNAEQTPPFALPDNGMVSGIKSNSTPGGGGYNGIELNDTKGSEKLSMHAQYNMDTTVENDQALTVHNNRTATVDVDETMSVGANQTLSVGGNQEIEVGGNQTEAVAGNRTDEVSGDEDRSVSGSQTVSIGADRTVETGANDSITAGANMEQTAGANYDMTAGANLTITAGANGEVGAGANLDLAANAMLNITAGAKISLSAGGSSIEIGPDGIKITAAAIVSINGMLVKIN